MTALLQRIAILAAACVAASVGVRPDVSHEVTSAAERNATDAPAQLSKALAEMEAIAEQEPVPRKNGKKGKKRGKHELLCEPDSKKVCMLPKRTLGRRPPADGTDPNAVSYIVKIRFDKFSVKSLRKVCKKEVVVCELIGNMLPYVRMDVPQKKFEKLLEKGHLEGVDYSMEDEEFDALPEVSSASQAQGGSAGLWNLDRIGASTRGNEGEGTHLFILDSGINTAHQDFEGRAIGAFQWKTSPFGGEVCQASDTSCGQDGNGHGTHVAGSAGGVTYGVAPKANLYAVKVLDDQGVGSFSSVIAGLDYVVGSSNRPAAVTLSLGGRGENQGMTDVVNEAVDQGVIIVIAAGNENDDACEYTPAGVASAIVVGATDSRDDRSPFSNYGECVDIYAPGSDILSAKHDADQGSVSQSGTSMACPQVAGAAALILAVDPALTTSEVLARLQQDATRDAIGSLTDQDTNNLLLQVKGGEVPTHTAQAQRNPPPAKAGGHERPRLVGLFVLLVWSFAF